MNLPGLIRAKITAKTSSSGQWLYAWKEVRAKLSDGTDEDPSPQRTGSTTISPAVEINNHEVSVNTYVWLRPRGFVAGVLWWEFQYEVSSSSPSVVETRITANIQIAADSPSFYTLATVAIPSPGTWFVYATATCVGGLTALGAGPGRVFMYVSGGADNGFNKGTNILDVNNTGSARYGQGADHFVMVTTGTPTLELRAYRDATGVTWATGNPQVLGGSSSGNQGRLGAFKIG